jgi:opacity protein-like surface antigen
MSAHRLAALVVLVLLCSVTAFAQQNEVSATFGRTFISTQTIQNSNAPDRSLHFGDEETIGLDYARWLKRRGGFGLSGEVPISFVIDQDLHTYENRAPENYKALFVAPSARLSFFSGDSVVPWVSAGAGYGRFKAAGHLNFYGPNPGKTITNTSVIQFGAGLDVYPWHNWGFRLEARDFYSGVPTLNDINTGRSRQHNYYVGGGVVRRF